MKRPNSNMVSASEIASWGWCPESWRLDSLGEPPSNVKALEHGEATHRDLIAAEHSSKALSSLGLWLLVAAGLLAVLSLVLRIAS